MENIKIRIATKQDVPKLLAIYAPYVERTAISFEYAVPTVQEFEQRMHHVLEKYPYLVAEHSGEIIGYAYAGAFNERGAYDWTAEATVYVHQDKKKMGIGKHLYQALENILLAQNILSINACIAYPKAEDEYLTQNSVQFHAHMGYRFVGEFHQCGYKFGRWYNVVWMEKHIAVHTIEPQAVKPFAEVMDIVAEKYGIQ